MTSTALSRLAPSSKERWSRNPTLPTEAIKQEGASNFSKRLLYPKPQVKGQTTLVMLVLVVFIFGGLVIFLLSMASGVSKAEYMNIYTHNLLLTVMRTDTGELDADCRLVSDALMSAFTHESITCGNSGLGHQEMAEKRIVEYLEGFELLKKYRYLLVVKSGSSNWVPLSTSGHPMDIRISSNPDDLNLDKEKLRGDKLVAGERVQRGGNILSVQLFLAKKPG